jgi:hypothetical protein
MFLFFFCPALRLRLKENFLVHEAGWVGLFCIYEVPYLSFFTFFHFFIFDSMAGLGWSWRGSEEL